MKTWLILAFHFVSMEYVSEDLVYDGFSEPSIHSFLHFSLVGLSKNLIQVVQLAPDLWCRLASFGRPTTCIPHLQERVESISSRFC